MSMLLDTTQVDISAYINVIAIRVYTHTYVYMYAKNGYANCAHQPTCLDPSLQGACKICVKT